MLQRFGSLSTRHQRLLLLLGCVILYGLWLSWVPLVQVDETRYVETTRHMFVTGDFVIPHYNDAPRYQKPILYYWIQAASVAVFGQNELAARLPSALLGLLLVLIVHAFLLRVFAIWARDRGQWAVQARGAAFLGAAALATLPLFAIWTRVAITDVTLTFFITGAMLALLLAELEPALARRWYLLASVSAGLAFLTKGPMGIAIPVAVWAVYHLWQRTLWQEIRRFPWVLGILIVLLINLPWYLATYFVDGPGFLRQFFFEENAQRFLEGAAAQKPTLTETLAEILEFLAGVMAMLFPYCAFLAHELLAPFAGNRAVAADDLPRRLRRFAWVWLIIVVGGFSLSQTRGLNYAQSISAAAAILFGLHLLGRFTRETAPATRAAWWGRCAERVMLVVIGVVFPASTIFVLGWQGSPKRFNWDIAFPQPMATVTMVLLLLTGLAFLASLVTNWLRKRDGSMVIGVMASWFALFAVILIGFAPMFIAASFIPVAKVGYYLRGLHPGDPVVTYMTKSPDDPESPEDIVYYGQRPAVFLSPFMPNGIARIQQTLATHGSLLLVTDTQGLQMVSAVVPVEVLKRFDFFIVCRAKHATTGQSPVLSSPR